MFIKVFKLAAIIICYILYNQIQVSVSFNLDTKFPIVYSDPSNNNEEKSSYFGFSVILQPSGEDTSGQTSDPWIQIGAPRCVNTISKKSSGAVFRCPIAKPCMQLALNHNEKDGDWMGVSMDVQSVETPGLVVVCGHRWHRGDTNRDTVYSMVGACNLMQPSYTNTSLNDYNNWLYPLSDRNHATFKRGDSSVYDWGIGQAGISVHFLNDKINQGILLGAPGVFNWGGSMIYTQKSPPPHGGHARQASIFANSIVSSIVPTSIRSMNADIVNDFDYFGYQVSSGHFFSRDYLVYVASAPRAKRVEGQVLLFKMLSDSRRELELASPSVKGSQMGEYFGASLAVGDYNGDGYDDLIVGAPLFSTDYDEGCVYVYSGNGEGTRLMPGMPGNENKQIIGVISGARFGTALTFLGDLDNDGYGDLAVGAPYEDGNSGSVYIFNGGQHGLEAKYSQRITARQVSTGLQGFGISISRPADIDNNKYKDVAVGSFISGHAVLFRAHPVVTLELSLVSDHSKILDSTKSFNVKVCLWYSGKYIEENLNVKRTVTVDREYRRAHLEEAEPNNDTLEVVLALAGAGEQLCEELRIILKDNITNSEEPIEIRVQQELDSGNPEKEGGILWINRIQNSGEDGFCKFCPVMTKNKLNPIETLSMEFTRDCGEDDVCDANLQIKCEFLGIRNGKYLVSGSKEQLKLLINVTNTGESAYSTRVAVRIPAPVILAKLPSSCDSNNVQDVMYLLVECDVENPLKGNRTIDLIIELDLSFVTGGTTALEFYTEVETKSNNLNLADNSRKITLELRSEADMGIIGTSIENLYSYTDLNNDSKTIILLHNYLVEKHGASPIERVRIDIMVPTSWRAKNTNQLVQFLQMYKPEGEQDDTQLVCDSDYNDYLIDSVPFDDSESSSRAKRSIVDSGINDNQSKNNPVTLKQLPTNRTLFLNCSSVDNVMCTRVWCISNAFTGRSARISIRMKLNVSNLEPFMGEKDIILLSSHGFLNIELPLNFTNLKANNVEADDATVETIFVGYVRVEKADDWLIALSICGGLLLLCFVIMGLIKAGFFKRTKKLELEALITADNDLKARQSVLVDQQLNDSD